MAELVKMTEEEFDSKVDELFDKIEDLFGREVSLRMSCTELVNELYDIVDIEEE